jgi:hypothetical protein
MSKRVGGFNHLQRKKPNSWLFGNLPAFVIPAVLARQMRHGGAAAIFTDSKRSFGQTMMAASLVAAASGLVLFRNTHKKILMQIRLIL